MIYIDENTTKFDINRLDFDIPTSIVIKDVLRNSTIEIDLSNIDMSKHYYSINIEDWTFKFINGSQYEYYLKNDNKTLSSGIIQCGKYNNSNTVEYIIEDKNYKQYNG